MKAYLGSPETVLLMEESAIGRVEVVWFDDLVGELFVES